VSDAAAFGLAMVVVLVVVALLIGVLALCRWSVHQARDDNGGPRKGAFARHVAGIAPCTLEEFHPFAERILATNGVRLFERRQWGRIGGYTSLSLMSYGSIVTIWYAPAPGGTGFTVESRPRQPLLLYDWGRNQSLADRIAHGLLPAWTG